MNQQTDKTEIAADERHSLILPTENSSKDKRFQHWFKFEKNEILLLLSYFIFGLAFANYEPYAPVWLNQFFKVESYLVIGLVVVIPNIMVLIGTTILGILADKFGAKKFVLVGLGAFVLMFLLLIFTTGPVYFLVIVLFGHFLGSAQTSNFYAFATKSINKPKEVILAKITMTVSLAFVILSPIVGLIYDSFSNSMTIQLIIATVACLISLVFVFFIIEKKETPEVVSKTVEDIAKTEIAQKRTPLTIVPWLFTGITFLVFAFQTAGGFWAYTSLYFLDTLSVKGLYYSIFLIAKTALAIPLAFLLGRLKSVKGIGLTTVLFTGWIAIDYLLMTLFPMNWIMILLIYSIPMYPLYNVSFYSLVTVFSSFEKRATAYGIFNTLGTAGYAIGIIILGVLADYSSLGILVMLRTSLIFAGIAFIISTLLFILRFRKEKITS
ncbi:MAG: MFS transporter [Promethearchaeota archaeon]